jgi:hypothetical protein
VGCINLVSCCGGLVCRELLRESWPWFGGVVAYGGVHRDDELTGYLAQTGLERFHRVLQIRDCLHIAAKGEPTSTRFDEATFELETLLLFLSATFDATARVAHVIYLGGSYEEAGWRRGPWLDRLAGRAPDLAAAVAEETRGTEVLQLIGALRNTIHGESMRAATVQQGGQTSRFVRLPAREEERLRQRIGSLGDDLDQWGLQDDHGRLQLVSDRLVERLIPESVRLLNQLMALTDTSLLPGAAGSPFRACGVRELGPRSRKRGFAGETELKNPTGSSHVSALTSSCRARQTRTYSARARSAWRASSRAVADQPRRPLDRPRPVIRSTRELRSC